MASAGSVNVRAEIDLVAYNKDAIFCASSVGCGRGRVRAASDGQ